VAVVVDCALTPSIPDGSPPSCEPLIASTWPPVS